MKHKAGLLGNITVGAVSAQAPMPVVTRVTTFAEYAPTTIQMVCGLTLTPKHVVSNDPWIGKPTSWVPVYYLQVELKSVWCPKNMERKYARYFFYTEYADGKFFSSTSNGDTAYG
ncbi:hypothetical protein ACOJUR_10890 [Alicyclobacillus tolerans]|uniref:hypothetical protein n=1 Tax=Alicyclobacillus tolerans TaxID=90970 RepID=UPI003B800F72